MKLIFDKLFEQLENGFKKMLLLAMTNYRIFITEKHKFKTLILEQKQVSNSFVEVQTVFNNNFYLRQIISFVTPSTFSIIKIQIFDNNYQIIVKRTKTAEQNYFVTATLFLFPPNMAQV